jgi:hypothetical protein
MALVEVGRGMFLITVGAQGDGAGDDDACPAKEKGTRKGTDEGTIEWMDVALHPLSDADGQDLKRAHQVTPFWPR